MFKASKETAQSAGTDLARVFSAISKIGAYQIKEFLAAVPIFIEFFVHLMKERHRLEASRQLLLVGGAAALSTLLGFLIVSVLGSWTVQLALIIAFPLLGVPLFLATGLAIATTIVLFVWLVIFVLNKALADDPAYQVIRERYLSTPAKRILSDIDDIVKERESDRTSKTSGASNPDQLYQLVEKQLRERGKVADADVANVISELEKMQTKLSHDGRQKKRFVKVAERVDQMKAPAP
jgi:hypothetical protein